MNPPIDNGVGDSSARRSGGPPAAPDFLAVRSLKRELLEELRARSPEGAPVTPEELLPRWPADPAKDADVASLLLEDFLQRQARGEKPSEREYAERFPAQADSLARLFEHQAVLRSVGGPSSPSGLTMALPAVGDQLFHFRLVQELGSGAFARVFLAEQADLAGRPVVLKISGITGSEPQTLAQLQHTHIVPIYSVHEDARAGLRAVCMPYFGGASLSQVLHFLWDASKPSPERGAQLAEALAAVGSRHEGPGGGAEPAQEAPALQLFRGSSYVRAACWVVARLAEALQHAHQRGVLHRDVKPSNVLLGADGQPMLLDFNLAQNQNGDQAQASAMLGGTVAYMAPEHLRAMFARDAALARLVDHRADIYALGMVLFEMLAGEGPFQQSGSCSLLPAMIEAMALERSRAAPSLRARRPDVPWGLESILQKCLAPLPSRRHRQAQDLAEDLDAFLNDAPLKHAPELSQAERLRKWARRHPRLTSSGSVAVAAAVLLLGAGAAFAGVLQHLHQVKQEHEEADAENRRKKFEADAVRAFALVSTVMLDTPEDQQDRAPIQLLGIEHLREGIRLCEQALGRYGVLDRADWEQGAAWRRLAPDDRPRLAEDVRELLLLLASARLEAWQRERGAGPHARPRQEVLNDALALVDRAAAIPGLPASPALWKEREYYCELLGDKGGARVAREEAAKVPPASARDHYLLALAHTRNRRADDPAERRGGAAAAVKELDEALRLNDRHYWSWLQRGLCRLELDDPALAAGDFGVCIGLGPEHPWGYFNRAVALMRMGRKAEAVADYTAAIERDRELTLAYLNRGIARLELQRDEEALADFDQARERGHDQAGLHLGRGVALERLRKPERADAAFEEAWGRSGNMPESAWLRMRWVYAFAISARKPGEARRVFREVVEKDPGQVQAWYGLGMLAADEKNLVAAIDCFSRALERSPGFTDARRFRAVLLARRGELFPAQQDINVCLDKEPRAGITLYAAACVASLTARHAGPLGSKEAAEQALDFLKQAFAEGYGLDKAETDSDLAAVRGHEGFQELMQTARAGR